MTSLEKGLLKGLASAGLFILGFLAVMVINDHTTLSSVTQWQDDYGKKIDEIDTSIHIHWDTRQSDTTTAINQ